MFLYKEAQIGEPLPSKDSKLLVFRNKAGEFYTVDTDDGELLIKVTADFEIGDEAEIGCYSNLSVVKLNSRKEAEE